MADEALPIETTPSPAPTQEPVLSSTDFEIDAFKILDSATDYNQGVSDLIKLYSSGKYDDQEKAKEVLADYGDKLHYKFKSKPLTDEELITTLPVKPNEVEGEDVVPKVTNYAQKNVEALGMVDDPDYIVASKNLIRQTEDYASRTRRIAKSNYGSGPLAWMKDKYFRAKEGLIGPYASLTGDTELKNSLREDTQPSRDQDLSSSIVSAASTIAPAALAFAIPEVGPAAGMAVIAGQTGGAARDIYEQSLAATGDETKATQAALLVASANAVGFTPAGAIAAGTVEKLGASALIKNRLGLVAAETLGAGAAGGAATVVSNEAVSVGFDRQQNLMDNFWTNVITFGTIGGIPAAGRAALDHVIESKITEDFKNLETKVNEEKLNVAAAAKRENIPVAETVHQEFYRKDAEGYFVPNDEQSTAKTRARDASEWVKAEEEIINEKPSENDITDEYGNKVLDTGIPNEVVEIPEASRSAVPVEAEQGAAMSPEEFSLTAKYGRLSREVKSWNTKVSDQAHRVLSNEKEANYIRKRIAELESKVEKGEKVEEGPSYENQLARYKEDLSEIEPLLKEGAEGVKEANTLKEYKATTEALRGIRQKQIISETTKSPEELKLQEQANEANKNIYQNRIILTSPEGQTKPNTLVTWLASKFLGIPELKRNIFDGALGVFRPNFPRSVEILRSLGADPLALSNTLAHEIGHATRFLLEDISNLETASPSLKKFITDWRDLYKLFNTSYDALELKEDFKNAALAWSPLGNGIYDPGYVKYRMGPEELFADTFSHMVNAPEKFAKDFPQLYAKFEDLLSNHPSTAQFWDTLQKMRIDPNEISKFNLQIRTESYRKHNLLQAEAINRKMEEKSVGRMLRLEQRKAYQFLFDRYSEASRVIKSWPKAVRDNLYDLYFDLKRNGSAHMFVDRNIDRPMEALLGKLKQANIPLDMFSFYEGRNRILKEETNTMAWIRDNYPTATEAAKVIKDVLSKQRGIKKRTTGEIGLEDVLDFNKINSPEELTDALARIQNIGDTAEIFDINDFKSMFDPADPQRDAKAHRAYLAAMNKLAHRKESIPIENTRKQIESMRISDTFPKEVKEAALDILSPGAFSARKYLINEFGATRIDAERDIAYIRDKLNAEEDGKFEKLQTLSAEFHNIMSSVLPLLRESRMFGSQVMDRLERNKGNYVTNNVLKYFEGDQNIPATLRTAVGSFNEVGNEVVSTVAKMKALAARAIRQRAINSAVDIAKAHVGLRGRALEAKATGEATKEEAKLLKTAGPNAVEEVMRGRPGIDIFAERDKLSLHDKKNSYLISYDSAGKPSLYKIADDKGFERMFKNAELLPIGNGLLDLASRISKALLVRQMKTTMSPAFTLGQKFYDRRLEAILANSFEFTGGLPMHLPGTKVRAIDKQTIQELLHYRKTGELIGNLKKLVDLDSVALDIAVSHQMDGLDTSTSISSSIYDEFGPPLPKEKNRLERIGEATEKVIDSTFGKFWDSVGLGPETAKFDELRTKVNGFAIGKSLGMSDKQAAVFSMENFGIPDPTGGGMAASGINKMFLFGRAHLNGLRVLGGILTNRSTALNLGLRVALPKVPMMAAVMGPVMATLFGDEEAQKYVKGINSIGRMEKMSRNCILLGWNDGQGNPHNFFDVSLSDIQADWTPWYFRGPQAREITSVTKAVWPFLENMFEGKPTAALGLGGQGALSAVSGNFNPIIQYAYNIMQLATGNNPTDWYRNKPILDADTALAGSMLDKGKGYLQYLAATQYPAAFPYNPFQTGTPVGAGQNIMQKVPYVGPTLRMLIGISNYGDIENDKELAAAQKLIDAEIRLSTDDATKELLKANSRAEAKRAALGENWVEAVGDDVAQSMHYLASWHSKMWQRYKQQLEIAKANGDTEEYEYLLGELRDASEEVLADYKGMASKMEEKK